jgi:uroporphyrinogen decarboxylase
MTGKERIQSIFKDSLADRPGFWLGNPADKTKIIYAKELNLIDEYPDLSSPDQKTVLLATKDTGFDIELHQKFKSDLYWACPHHTRNFYNHPESRPVFDFTGGRARKSLNQAGVFAETESVADIEAFAWPNPDYVNLSETFEQIADVNDLGMAVFSGMWAPFFHDLCDFFGMENYFLKMFTFPQVVEAATRKIMEFYLEINERIYQKAANKIDAVFFGSDLGSQYNALIGPNEFRMFVLPYIKQITDQAKKYHLPVVMHSCGSVYEFIPDLIDAGIDGLHPLQAKAANMDAVNLAKNFKDKLVFIGGVDTQDLLPFGTPQQIKDEIARIADIFGGRFIVSPSHEALLPNVPFENAIAMRDAVVG